MSEPARKKAWERQQQATASLPPSRIDETAGGHAYLIEVALGDARPEDMAIEVTVGTVTVTAAPSDQGGKGWSRIFEFSSELDTDGARTMVENGILRIEVPKALAARRRVFRVGERAQLPAGALRTAVRQGSTLTRRPLQDRRIAILTADGFEKLELTLPRRALRRAGARVDIVSLRPGRIRGANLHEPAGRARVSRTLGEARAVDYDGLFIPGGFIAPDLLRQSAAARDFVRAFDAQGKPIATLCHGPWLLASAELVAGRTMTSWPGIRDDLVHAGATWLDREVVRDRNWVTSRGPQDLAPFVRAMTELFAAPEAIPSTAPSPAGSSPKSSEPPAAVIRAMKWLPRPSLRTAVGLGLLGAGWLVRSRGRAFLPRRARRSWPRAASLLGRGVLGSVARARTRRA